MADKAVKLAMLKARIFGQVVKPPNVRSPSKLMRKSLRGPEVMEYFKGGVHPRAIDATFKPLRALSIFKDEDRDWRERQLKSYVARGKAIVKKGGGKRAAKTKGKK